MHCLLTCAGHVSGLYSEYFSADFAKSDASCTGTITPGTHHQHVAIFKESPLLSVSERDGPFTAGAELQQRSGLLGRRSGLGSGTEQVSRLEIAAVDRVVRHELRCRPVGMAEAGARQPLRRDSLRAH